MHASVKTISPVNLYTKAAAAIKKNLLERGLQLWDHEKKFKQLVY
jgi:hypothetical protein